jgi:hypothetical protein
MVEGTLDKISEQLPASGASGKSVGNPPLHLWNPGLSGDIDIVIRRDGSWEHEGALIKRQALVNLFASILRRESDGDYYLVTPVEKWRIRVEALPFVIVDFELVHAGGDNQLLSVVTNTGRHYAVGAEYPLYLPRGEEGADEKIPAVRLDHGLAALFSRAAWYRLVESCEERDGQPGISSQGLFFPISA